MRTQGVTINDTALIHTPPQQRNKYTHSIIAEAEETFAEVHIPLELEGQTTSYFLTRKPTRSEIENLDHSCIHVHMTPTYPWEPGDRTISENEWALRAHLTDDAEPRERGRNLNATSTKFATFSQTSAIEAPPQQPVSETASHRVQISRIRRQNASAEVDIDSFAEELERVSISAVQTKARKGTVSPETLAKRWHIGIERARKTIDRTTQLAVRDFTNTTGGRRLKPIHQQLKYRRLDVEMYCDVLIGRCVSLLGNKYAAIYCTPFHWIAAEPIASRSDVHKTLDSLFQSVGVPRVFIPDGAGELVDGEFKKKVSKFGSRIHPIEAYTPNANIAEDGIRELKRLYRRTMIASNTPACLWDRCIYTLALIRQHTVNSVHELEGEVPATKLTGETADISHLCEFGWYDYVWYIDPQQRSEAMETKRLGRYCGPSTNHGDAMSSMIITDKARFVHRTSVFPIKEEEWSTDAFKERVANFEASLKEKLKDKYDPIEPCPEDDEAETPTYEPYEPVEPGDKEALPELAEADDIQHEAYDRYISARVKVPRGDDWAYGTVKKQKRDADGNLIGQSNKNPLFDSSIYEVELDDGEKEAFSANIIAEHIYSQVDDEGFTHFTLSEIVDHRKDSTAISKDDAFITMRNGKRKPRITTKGWQLCCQWNDGSTSWHPLKDLKESHPLQVAEYAVNNKIAEEPAFSWWVKHALNTRDRIISKMKSRYLRRDQKYGIEIPKTVERALEIDKETGTTFWYDAICKEMKNNAKAFKILGPDATTPVGHTFIKCHMVFDVKQGTLQRKCRFVAGGHMAKAPPSITYASVVSRESVRIAFLIAALNDLDIKAADIGNAYLNAPPREKIYIKCGPEFGPEFEGRYAIIVRALYGLKSSGASWRSFLARVLDEELNFKMCRADNDVWFKPAKKADGTRYYIYVLVYTDDILCVAERPKETLDKLDQHFLLKPESRGRPKIYLGAEIGTYRFEAEPTKTYWSMSSNTYVKESVKNVETHLATKGRELKKKVSLVLPINYAPELDATPLCDEDDVSEYHSRIGVLRWAVELGRVDICTEVSIMASYAAAPRKGHLEAVYHIFAWLKFHKRSRLVFDSDYPNNKEQSLPDWTDFYKDVKEQIPKDAPEPLGKPVEMTSYIDSDHAGDKITRRSRTGVFIFLNRSLIVWHSKKQSSIETSSFGSEFSAMKTGVELVEGLRYKLRMMGIPIDGPCHIKADNLSVVRNSSQPESTLKKKSNSIAFHYVRERAAARVISVQYEPSETNLADMLTKIQLGSKRLELAHKVLF